MATAIDRATHKAGGIANERARYIRKEFAKILERRGVFGGIPILP